jgi:hypothetical protein
MGESKYSSAVLPGGGATPSGHTTLKQYWRAEQANGHTQSSIQGGCVGEDVLRRAMLCYAMLCCAVLCYAVLCCAGCS